MRGLRWAEVTSSPGPMCHAQSMAVFGIDGRPPGAQGVDAVNKYGRWLMLWMLLATPLAHAGTVTYVYTDPQGTPLAEADAQGNITARFEYTPYGVPVPSVGAAPDGVGYTGHVNDPDTGLVYMQARYYDPMVGRFLSVDPVTAYDKPGQNFNRYWYANNNPARYTDPDGRNPLNPIDAYYFAKDVGGLLVTEIVAGAAFVTGNDEVLGMALADMSAEALDAAASTAGFVSPAPGAGKGIKAGSRILKMASDHGKNERHGDGGRAMAKADKRVDGLKQRLAVATGREAKKIEQKIKNIIRDAQKKDRGEEHSRREKK